MKENEKQIKRFYAIWPPITAIVIIVLIVIGIFVFGKKKAPTLIEYEAGSMEILIKCVLDDGQWFCNKIK